MKNMSERDYYDKRISALDRERSSFITHWKELSQYIEPRRGRFFVTDRNKGEKMHNHIINSRASQALRNSQSGLFAGTMNPARPWFKLETLDPDMMRSHAVKEWMYNVERLIRTILLESNFYNQAPVMLGELLLFGTGAMSHVDDFENVARFYTHTAGSYYIGQNDRFVVDTFAVKRQLTVSQIVKAFGQDKVSKAVSDAYDRGDYDKWYDVCQLIEPNEEFDSRSPKADKKAFKSVWWEPGNTKKDQFLRKSGFDEFPVHVTRWGLTGEDIYGTTCPGMTSLGDVKSLQIMEKRKAQAVDKLVNPPLKGPPSLRDVPISSLPGGITLYDGDGTKEGLTSLYQVDPRLNEMRADMAAVENRINEAFFVDLFLAITAMEGIQPRNQLELTQRNEERLLMLGPPLERIKLEFLSMLIDRVFNQCVRANILPPAPPELEGMALGIRYISSLAMAQRAVEIGAIERIVAFQNELVATHPEVVDKINADEMLEQYSHMVGGMPSLIVPQEMVDARRQQRAQQQAAMQQAEMQAQQAQAANQGSQAVKNTTEAIRG